MTQTLTIEPKSSTLQGAITSAAAQLSSGLEGRKQWKAHNRLVFETSEANIRLAMSLLPAAVVQDRRKEISQADLLGEDEHHPSTKFEPEFVMEPMDFQLENYEKFKNKLQWAIFSVQGSGKSKTAIDIISYRYKRGTVTGVILLSSPKGVHAQWIEEQLPKHLWKSICPLAYIWDGKKVPSWVGTQTKELQIISGNIDMLKSKGYEVLQKFATQHKEKLLIVVDESDSIKNLSSVRSKRLRQLAVATKQRGIMSGTPIAKDLTDEFAQFYFLNPDIIGHKYISSFRAQYCVMGGFENRSVVGHRNVDQFKRLTAPHIFRATKDQLNLPPKVYDSVVFDLTPIQKKMIKDLREQFFASLPEGNAVAVRTGAVSMLRIQQISNGFAVDEDGAISLLDNPRMEALKALRHDIGGPVVIWCRFQQDVISVQKEFPGAVTIYGPNTQEERDKAKQAFISGAARELIATPGAAGKGVDGLQRVCSDAIYYSNSYNAIDRWQSEDRIDRLGSIGTASFFDLIARGSIDRAILRNLKHKQDISSLALDNLKQIMEEIE